jgi:hypothetical protein
MNHLPHRNPKDFSNRKITVNQAIKILKHNGIKTNEDQAAIILDFLYLIAKTYSPNIGN